MRRLCCFTPIMVHRWGTDLRYQSHRIYTGKYELEGLPHVRPEEGCETLEIILRDTVEPLEVTLYYGVLEQRDVISRCMVDWP